MLMRMSRPTSDRPAPPAVRTAIMTERDAISPRRQASPGRPEDEAPLALLGVALEMTREGVVVTDARAPDEPILYVNEGFERITGYSRREVIGTNCRFLQGPQTQPERTDRIRRALREGTDVQVELLNHRKDGSAFWNLVSISPIRDAEGRITHHIAIQSDVTERHEAREALREARDHLEQRVRERTAELEASGLALKEEVAERREAERKLLRQQHRLRELASKISRAEDSERRRIASELHDRLSQGLVALKVRMEMLLGPVGHEPGGAQEAAGLLASVDALVDETRTMMFELCPPMLYDLGLAAALEELVEKLTADNGLSCELVADGRDRPLSMELRSFLYRATRELLTNVARHARAGSAVVSLGGTERTVSLSVEDDGQGFDADRIQPGGEDGGHFGLFHIRERLDTFGGWLLHESSPGKGTKMTMIVPLTDQGACGEREGEA